MPDIKSAFTLYQEMKEKGLTVEARQMVPKFEITTHSRKDGGFEQLVPKREERKEQEAAVGYAGERLALIEKIYEKARYQKLYGIEAQNEEKLSQDAVDALASFGLFYPEVICRVRLTALLQDDRGNPYPSKPAAFFGLLQKVFLTLATVKLIENSRWKITALVMMKAREIHGMMDVFTKVDLVEVSLPNRSDPANPKAPETIIIHTPDLTLCQRVDSEIYQIIESRSKKANFSEVSPLDREFVHAYAKEVRAPAIARPTDEDYEFILSNAHLLYPWLHRRYATLQKIVYNQKAKRDELRFYRNSYKNGKHKIVFDSLSVLQEQIGIGAFAFIADSACTNSQELPCGPYSICLDFDPSDTKLSYDDLLNYVIDFHIFFTEVVGFDPKSVVWLHSGNTSFHVRIGIPEFDANQMGLLLPKTHSFDTYYRRKREEMNVQLLHDAVELLVLQYNLEYTKLDRVAHRVPAFVDRNQFKLFADNRTQLHGGARVPLSWHTKSHQYCRVFDINNIPDNAVELKYLCSREYLKRHTQWLELPKDHYKNGNAELLFSTTSEYLTKNFNTLVYKLQVFNGKADALHSD